MNISIINDSFQCDTIKCYYKHDGVWKDDDIDDEAVKTKLQSIDSKNPPAQRAAERILKHCLNGKYMKYGKDDACPAMKYFLCSYINTVVVSTLHIHIWLIKLVYSEINSICLF